MMRIFFIFIILIHGLIHLMGFVKAFHPAEVPQLEQSISKPAGIFWLIAAILFILTALLFFNEKGELINFSSNDRYESGDGKNYNNYRWTTPVRDYKEFNRRKVISYGDAIWHKPEGDFCYGKFRLVKVDYNCDKYFVNSEKED